MMNTEGHFYLENDELCSKDDETGRHPLDSGIPCQSHGCTRCCIETRMPLSHLDIEKISRQGYKFKDFVVKRGRGRYLKNRGGRCVFLGENGCKIYHLRPEGCRLYPLVFDESSRKAVLHHPCPHGKEFRVGRKDRENLNSLFNELSNEGNRSR